MILLEIVKSQTQTGVSGPSLFGLHAFWRFVSRLGWLGLLLLLLFRRFPCSLLPLPVDEKLCSSSDSNSVAAAIHLFYRN